MRPYSFYSSLISISLNLFSLPVFAALQPAKEAPLATEVDLQCHFNQDGSTDCVSAHRYTILKPNGRELISRLDFSFSETDSMVLEKAELIQPGKKPVPLDQSQIDTRMAPNPDQGFLREKQTSIAFPNLRVGTSIAYTVRHHYAAKPVNTEFHYIQSFSPSPVRYDSFKAKFTAERPIIWRSELMDDFTLKLSSDKKTLLIEQKQPRYLNYINESSDGYIRQIPRVELGSSQQLQDNFGPFARRYNEILATKLPTKSAAAVRGAEGKPATQRVAALMQYLNENYRYLGDWRTSERGHIPFNLAEIEQHGYGDCKDLAILLAAMLKASGIKAESAWVKRGPYAPSLLIPGIYAPDHAIVRAEVDDQVWWLDPTNPVFAPGRIMDDIQERWVLVADANSQVRKETIPVETPDVNTRVQSENKYSNDNEAQIKSSVVLANAPLMNVSMSDRYQGVSSTDQDLCRGFAREFKNCDLKRAESHFVLPERYEIKANLTDLQALQKLSGQYLYSRDDLGAIWSDLAEYRLKGQLADIFLGDPHAVSYDVSLVGGNIDAPAHSCKVRSPWFDIDLNSEPVDGNYRYHYQQVQKRRWLSHNEINSVEFQALIEQGRNCAEKLRLTVQLPEK